MAHILLKHIAEEAGVSVTTVSFVLNGKAKEKRISDAIIEKVEKIIEANNFKPNAFAKGLRTGKTATIALIVEDIGNAFFANIAKKIELIAYKKGYKVVFASTDNNELKAKELLELMRSQHVDGLIVIPTPGLRPSILQLTQKKVPIILFDRYFEDVPTNYVILDNFQGSYKMTQALIKSGKRKIGFATIDSQMTQMVERLEGYRQCLKDHSIPYDEDRVMVFPHISPIQIDPAFMEARFRAQSDLDAIFFATNYLGILGLECLNNLNKSIPGDIGVASFDDHDLFRLFRPPISVVAQPIEDLANAAIEMLLNLISHESIQTKQVRVMPQIIIRNSF